MERLNLSLSVASSSVANANQLPPHPSTARPPSQPKASRNVAVERQRQLKDRLKLGWTSKPSRTANSDFSDATGIVPGSGFPSSGGNTTRTGTGTATFSNLVKGYGEHQFADSVVLEEKSLHGLDGGSHFLGDNSSVFTEHTNLKRPRFASPSIEDTKKIRTAPELSVSFYSTRQGELQAPSMTLGNPLQNSLLHGSTMTGTTAFAHSTTTHRNLSYKSKLQSHLSLSQSLAEDGMESVVDTLVSGKAAFCYLQKENDSFYDFSIKDNVPSTMLKNEYITLSAKGVVRANADGGFDAVDFPTLARERTIYMKLKEINVFRTYHSWKMFYVWKIGIRMRRFERNKLELEKTLIYHETFCRNLLYKCKVDLERLKDIQVLAIDVRKVFDFQEFLQTQRSNNQELKTKITQLIEEIIEYLCSQSEEYILEAAKDAPASIASKLFNHIRASLQGDPGQLINVAKTAKDVIQHGVTFDPTAFYQKTMEQSQHTTDHIMQGDSFSFLEELEQKQAKSQSRGDARHGRQQSTAEDHGHQSVATGMGHNTAHLVEEAGITVPYTIRASVRLRCRRLVGLFHVINFMIRDALYELIHHVLTDLTTVMRTISEQRRISTHFGLQLEVEDVKEEVIGRVEHVEQDRVVRRQYKNNYQTQKHKRDQVNNYQHQKISHGFFLLQTVLLSHVHRHQHALPPLPDAAHPDGNVEVVAKHDGESDGEDSVDSSDESGNEEGGKDTKNEGVAVAQDDDDEDDEHRVSLYNYYLGGKLRKIELDDFLKAAIAVTKLYGDTFISNREDVTASAATDAYLISAHSVLTCVPSISYYLQEFEQILKETGLICSFVDGVFSHSRCQNLFTPIRGELVLTFTSQLEDRIFLDFGTNNEVPKLLRSVLTTMTTELDFIHQEIHQLMQLRHEFHHNFQLYQQTLLHRLQQYSSDSIVQQLSSWDDQLQIIHRLVASHDFGIFRIDLDYFKQLLRRAVVSNIDLYHRIIPELYIQHGDGFYRDLSNAIDRIQAKFHTMDDFIKIVEVYTQSKQKVELVESRFSYIQRLRDIIEQRGIRISDAILRQNLTITSTYQKFQHALHDFEDILELQVKIYRNEIQQRLTQVMTPIHEFQQFIQQLNHFMQLEDYFPNVDDIVHQLQTFQHQIQNITMAKLRTLDYYQTILHVYVFERGLEHEVLELLQANVLLWQSWKAIMELTNHFMTMNFLDVHCDRIQKEVLVLKYDLLKHPFFIALHESIMMNSNSSNPTPATSTTGKPNRSTLKALTNLAAQKPAGEEQDASNGGGKGKEEGGKSSGSNQKDQSAVTKTTDSNRFYGLHRTYQKILEMSNALLHLIPMIQHLQSPTLKTTHVHRIHKVIGHNIFDVYDPTVISEGNNMIHVLENEDDEDDHLHFDAGAEHHDLTVGELIDVVEIIQYAGEIQAIYEESRIQHHLENRYHQVHKFLTNIEFVFDHDQENRSFLYISNLSSIIMIYEDCLMELQTLLQSKYIDNLRLQVQQTLREVRYHIDCIQSLFYFQTHYFKQRLYFSSPRIARSLAPFMKIFKTLDEIWRFVIKTTRNFPKLQQFFHVDQGTSTQLMEKLSIAKDNVQLIYQAYRSAMTEQCEKYPKLYCVDRLLLEDIFLVADLKQLYLTLGQFMFPFLLTDIEIEAAATATTSSSNNAPAAAAGGHGHGTNATGGSSQQSSGSSTSRGVIVDTTAFAGIVSMEEKLYFNKACGGRSNITDWLKNMDSMIADRVERDIKELATDQVSHPITESHKDLYRFCEQSLMTTFQVKFWRRIEQIMHTVTTNSQNEDSHDIFIGQMKSYQLELNDQMSMISTLLTDSVTSHQTKLLSNILLLMMQCRDIVKTLTERYQDGFDTEPFVIDSAANSIPSPSTDAILFMSMKKTYDTVSNVMYFEQGGIREKYGMKYQGFTTRMVILPMVEKCFFAIHQAFRQQTMPLLTSANVDVYTSSEMVKALAYETGSEFIHIPIIMQSTEGFEERLARYIQASIRTGIAFGLNISNERSKSGEIFAWLSNVMSAIYRQYAHDSIAALSSAAMGVEQVQQHIARTTLDDDKGDGAHEGIKKGMELVVSQEVKMMMERNYNVNINQSFTGEYCNVNSTGSAMYLPKFAFFLNDHEPSKIMSSNITTSLHSNLKVLGPKMKSFNPSSNLQGNANVEHVLTTDLGQLFRPVTISTLPFHIVLSSYLYAFHFAFVSKLAYRLEALIEFLIANRHFPSALLKPLLIHCIKHIGIEHEHTTINVSMQLNMITKQFFHSIPSSYQQNVDESEIRLICNLFLDIVYNPNTDLKDFHHQINGYEVQNALYTQLSAEYFLPGFKGTSNSASSSHTHHDVAYDMFTSHAKVIQGNRKQCFVVNGRVGYGKSTLIQKLLMQIQQDQILSKQAYENSLKRGEDILKPLYFVHIYPRRINPKLLLDVGKNAANDVGSADMLISICQALQDLIGKELQDFTSQVTATTLGIKTNMKMGEILKSTIFYFHLDFTSSYLMNACLPHVMDYLYTYFPNCNVQLICEVVEIHYLNPSFLLHHVQYFQLEERMYTLEDVFTKCCQDCIEHESLQFQKLMTDCKEKIIKPCVANYASDSELSQFTLVKNIFRLISAMFHYYVFPPVDNSTSSYEINAIPNHNNNHVLAWLNTVATSGSSNNINNGSLTTAAASANTKLREWSMKQAPPGVSSYVGHLDEDTIRRIVVFACIWTVGVSSATSREQFNDWFHTYFGTLASDTKTTNEQESLNLTLSAKVAIPNSGNDDSNSPKSVKEMIFPIKEGVSVFQFLLIRSEGSVNTLDWFEYECESRYASNKASTDTAPMASSTSQQSLDLLWSTTFNKSNVSLLLPSLDLAALTYIQAALSHSIPLSNKAASCLLLLGESGCGKSSLLQQLLYHMAIPQDAVSKSYSTWDACRRWICHKQASPYSQGKANSIFQSSQRCILQCHDHMQASLFEYNLGNYGAFFIEDVHLSEQFEDNPLPRDSPEEVIRYIAEEEAIYDSDSKRWHAVPLFYTVMTANFSNQSLPWHQHMSPDRAATPGRVSEDRLPTSNAKTANQRLTQHSMVYYCPSDHVNHIFAMYMKETCPNSILGDLYEDLVSYSQCYLQLLQRLILQKYQSLAWISGTDSLPGNPASNEYTCFANTEKLTLVSFLSSPPSVWNKWIIAQVSNSIVTLSGVTAQDMLRIYDRCMADLVNRYITTTNPNNPMLDLFNQCHDMILNQGQFSHPTFLPMMEKERSIRLANLDLMKTGVAPPLPHEGLSYSRNCLGFYRTGNVDIFPTIWTGEYVREIITKKLNHLMNNYQEQDEMAGSQNNTPKIGSLMLQRSPSQRGSYSNRKSILSMSMSNSTNNANSNKVVLIAPYLDKIKALRRKQQIDHGLHLSKQYKNSMGFWNDILRLITIWKTTAYNTMFCQSSVTVMLEGTNLSVGTHHHPDHCLPFAAIHDRIEIASHYFENCQVRSITLESKPDMTSMDHAAANDPWQSYHEHDPFFDMILRNFITDEEVLTTLKLYLMLERFGLQGAIDFSTGKPTTKGLSLQLIDPFIWSVLQDKCAIKYVEILTYAEEKFQQLDITELLYDEKDRRSNADNTDQLMIMFAGSASGKSPNIRSKAAPKPAGITSASTSNHSQYRQFIKDKQTQDHVTIWNINIAPHLLMEEGTSPVQVKQLLQTLLANVKFFDASNNSSNKLLHFLSLMFFTNNHHQNIHRVQTQVSNDDLNSTKNIFQIEFHETIRRMMYHYAIRQHYVLCMDSQHMIPDQLQTLLQILGQEDSIIHVISPYQDRAEDDVVTRNTELLNHNVESSMQAITKSSHPKQAAAASQSTSLLPPPSYLWKDKQLLGSQNKLQTLLQHYSACGQYILRQVKEDAFCFVAKTSSRTMRLMHPAHITSLLSHQMVNMSTFFSRRDQLEDYMQIFYNKLEMFDGLLRKGHRIVHGANQQTDLSDFKLLVLCTLLSHAKILATSNQYLILHHHGVAHHSGARRATHVTTHANTNNSSSGSHDEVSYHQSSIIALLDSELCAYSHDQQHQSTEDSPDNEKEYSHIFHAVLIATTCSMVKAVVGFGISKLGSPFHKHRLLSQTEDNLTQSIRSAVKALGIPSASRGSFRGTTGYSSVVEELPNPQRVLFERYELTLSILKQKFGKIFQLYLILPSSSSLKSWLASLMYQLLMCTEVRIVDYTMFGIYLLNVLLDLQLDTKLHNIVVEAGTVSCTIKTNDFFHWDEELDLLQHFIRFFPWEAKRDHADDLQSMELVILPHEQSFVADLLLLYLLEERFYKVYASGQTSCSFADVIQEYIKRMKNAALLWESVSRDIFREPEPEESELTGMTEGNESAGTPTAAAAATPTAPTIPIILQDDEANLIFDTIWHKYSQSSHRILEAMSILWTNCIPFFSTYQQQVQLQLPLSGKFLLLFNQWLTYLAFTCDVNTKKAKGPSHQKGNSLTVGRGPDEEDKDDEEEEDVDEPNEDGMTYAAMVSKSVLLLVTESLLQQHWKEIHAKESMQLLWNCCLDLFFTISSNPFNFQQYYHSTHLHTTTHHHHNAQGNNAANNSNTHATLATIYRNKLMTNLRYLSITEHLTKTAKLGLKYGIVRREKLPKNDSVEVAATKITTVTEAEEEEEEEEEADEEKKSEEESKFGSEKDEEEDVEEDISLSDTARAVLKPSLTLIAQYMLSMSSHSEAHSHNVSLYQRTLQDQKKRTAAANNAHNGTGSNTSPRGSTLIPAPVYQQNSTNLGTSIVTAIENNMEEWMNWIGDLSLGFEALPAISLGKQGGEYECSALDKILLAATLKPVLLPSTLLQVIAQVGFGINNVAQVLTSLTAVLSNESVATTSLIKSNDHTDNICISPASIHTDFSSFVSLKAYDEEDGHLGEEEEDEYATSQSMENLETLHFVIPFAYRHKVFSYLQDLQQVFQFLPGFRTIDQSESDGRHCHVVLSLQGPAPSTELLADRDYEVLTYQQIRMCQHLQSRFASLRCQIHFPYMIQNRIQSYAITNGEQGLRSVPLPMKTQYCIGNMTSTTSHLQLPPQRQMNMQLLASLANGSGNALYQHLLHIIFYMMIHYPAFRMSDRGIDNLISMEYCIIIELFAHRLKWLMTFFHLHLDYYLQAICIGKGMKNATVLEVSDNLLPACVLVMTSFKHQLLRSIQQVTSAARQNAASGSVNSPMNASNRSPMSPGPTNSTSPGSSGSPMRRQPAANSKKLLDMIVEDVLRNFTVAHIFDIVMEAVYKPCIIARRMSSVDFTFVKSLFDAVFLSPYALLIHQQNSCLLYNQLSLPSEYPQFSTTNIVNVQKEVARLKSSSKHLFLQDLIMTCWPNDSMKEFLHKLKRMYERGDELDELPFKVDSDQDSNQDADGSENGVMDISTGFHLAFTEFVSQAATTWHQQVLYSIEESIVKETQRILNFHEKFSSIASSHLLHQVNYVTLASTGQAILSQIRAIIAQFVAALPTVIVLDGNDKILTQMQAHVLKDDFSSQGATPSTQTTNTAGVQPRPPAHGHYHHNRQENAKRRLGQRIIIRFQSREYDTLWAYLLMEVLQFNKAILSLQDSLQHLTTLSTMEDWIQYFRLRQLAHRTGSLDTDALEGQVWRFFQQLIAGYVPDLWLTYQDSYLQSIAYVKVEQWMTTLLEQKRMLMDWLETGNPLPSSFKLHLLNDTKNFFYALKESFAYKAENSVDKVHLQYELLPMTAISTQSTAGPSAASASNKPNSKTASSNAAFTSGLSRITFTNAFYTEIDNSIHASSLGCHVYIGGLSFHNALFSGRTNMLEFIPEFHTSSFGSDVILHVYASLEEHNISLDENYMCPLFVASNAYLPHRSAMASLATSSGPHAHAHLPCHPYQSEDMLCRIPVCTTEDIQDCAVHRIALYSAPTWIVPST